MNQNTPQQNRTRDDRPPVVVLFDDRNRRDRVFVSLHESQWRRVMEICATCRTSKMHTIRAAIHRGLDAMSGQISDHRLRAVGLDNWERKLVRRIAKRDGIDEWAAMRKAIRHYAETTTPETAQGDGGRDTFTPTATPEAERKPQKPRGFFRRLFG